MGKILLYRAGRASQSTQANTSVTSNAISTHQFKSVDGTEYNNFAFTTNNTNAIFQNFRLYDGLTGVVSADTETDFSLDHYTTREIENVSYNRTSTNQLGGKIYAIQVTNNGLSDIIVNSIKFKKTFISIVSGTYREANCVALGYFLDAPVTIGVGETKTFAINLDS